MSSAESPKKTEPKPLTPDEEHLKTLIEMNIKDPVELKALLWYGLNSKDIQTDLPPGHHIKDIELVLQRVYTCAFETALEFILHSLGESGVEAFIKKLIRDNRAILDIISGKKKDDTDGDDGGDDGGGAPPVDEVRIGPVTNLTPVKPSPGSVEDKYKIMMYM